VVVIDVSGEDFAEAKRVYKQCKAGMYDSIEELSARQLGLLYLFFPHALPDVDPSETTE